MSAPGPRDDDRAFARLLRHWRHARGVSQLALAADAEVSIRHLSFLETGRARPSREMVERLDWEELAGALVAQVHRDAAASPDAAALRDELLAYPGVPARWRTPDRGVTAPPLLTMRLQRGDLRLAFFSTITVLATPQDVTLQQLRIECFHPADVETEAAAARLAAATAPGAARAAGSAVV